MIRAIDALFPVPAEVSRRAWECAFDLGQHHSNYLGAALWLWLLTVVNRDPEHLTWGEVGALFRLHKLHREGARHG